MFMSIWQGVGFHMVIWLSGLQTIPGTCTRPSSIDGANSWQKFRYITWPGLRQTRTFILITITISAFSLFTQVQVMTQGGPLDATTTFVFQAVRAGFAQQQTGYASAISLVFFVLVLAVPWSSATSPGTRMSQNDRHRLRPRHRRPPITCRTSPTRQGGRGPPRRRGQAHRPRVLGRAPRSCSAWCSACRCSS